MMKNGIKKLLVGALFVGVSLGAVELEEFNQYIFEAKHPDFFRFQCPHWKRI